MLFWILAGLAVLLVSIYVPAMLFLPTEGLMRHLGARDSLPDAGALTIRARRAHANLLENMPFFLTLGVLALVVEDVAMGQAILGAKLFVLGRIAYLVAYLSGIPMVRSVMYTIGLIGCVMMALALI